MPIYNEVWEEEGIILPVILDFMFRNMINLQSNKLIFYFLLTNGKILGRRSQLKNSKNNIKTQQQNFLKFILYFLNRLNQIFQLKRCYYKNDQKIFSFLFALINKMQFVILLLHFSFKLFLPYFLKFLFFYLKLITTLYTVYYPHFYENQIITFCFHDKQRSQIKKTIGSTCFMNYRKRKKLLLIKIEIQLDSEILEKFSKILNEIASEVKYILKSILLILHLKQDDDQRILLLYFQFYIYQLYNSIQNFKKCSKKTVQTLTKNHVKLLDNLKFEFVEYKANQLLACHLYDRMAQHCKNQFGLFEDSYVPECLDARNYFQLCVRMNASYGLAKKYFPEYFLTNEYSRPNPNFKELGL